MSIPEGTDHLNPTGFDPDFATPVEWALMYRACGLQVIPSYLPGEIKGSYKRPLPSWADLQDAIAPDFTFDRWYGTNGEHRGRSNMGILTGRCSDNVYVIDLDIQKYVDAGRWWQGLLAVHNNNLPLDTPTQQTGGGGLQMLFRAPADWHAPTNRTSIGVDIRGQGGFAVMPPSRHESGKEYAWMPGMEPWHMAIAMSPDWLLDEILELVEAHGGDKVRAERTPSPDGDRNAFGSIQDGREAFMARSVYHAVLEAYRRSPIAPMGTLAGQISDEAYEVYEREVISRIPDVPKREGLELEGRGPALWALKWRREMKKWGSAKMKVEAARPNPHVDHAADFEPPPKVDPDTGQPLPLLQSSAQFLKGFVPPNYLIDHVIQQHYLYALTARTGHGKTAIAMLMGQAVARGTAFHGQPCKQGNVLFLAGENPQDIRARFLMLAHYEKFDAYNVPFYFVDGVIDIAAKMPVIKAEAEKIGDLALVIVDTAAAYFRGDDANNNVQQGQFAQLLRQLITLPSNPAVLVNCHPTKNAGKDNLVPLGGVHFLNEIDGNLQLWADDRVGQLWPHTAKWRGAPFEVMDFEFPSRLCPAVRDAKGREMSSVIAVPIAEAAAEARAAGTEDDENALMRSMHHYPNASIAELAKQTGFLLADGKAPHKSKVHRLLETLLKSKLVSQFRNGRYRLTKKGAKAIGVKLAEDDN